MYDALTTSERTYCISYIVIMINHKTNQDRKVYYMANALVTKPTTRQLKLWKANKRRLFWQHVYVTKIYFVAWDTTAVKFDKTTKVYYSTSPIKSNNGKIQLLN